MYLSETEVRREACNSINSGGCPVFEIKARLSSYPRPGTKAGDVVFKVEQARKFEERITKGLKYPNGEKTCLVSIPGKTSNETIFAFRQAFGDKLGIRLNILGWDNTYKGKQYGVRGKKLSYHNGIKRVERKVDRSIIKVTKMGLALDTHA